jgi:hypothetical protein
MAYTKYSLTPANNNAAPPDGAPEGMLPSAVNDTMRDMMAQIRDVGDGIRDGTYTMTAPKITGGSITGITFSSIVVTGRTFSSSWWFYYRHYRSSSSRWWYRCIYIYWCFLKGSGTSALTTATAGTDYAGIDTAQTFTKGQRGEITGLTDGATITPDLADSNNFSVTLGGNRTLANPSNIVAGQSGSFFITQDGTGSRTLAYGSYYDFAGGTAPTLSTTASAVDRIDYVVRTATSIHCSIYC